MSLHHRSIRIVIVLTGSLSGFAVTYMHPAAAQQAAQPTAEDGAGLEEIVVAGRPTSVQLLEGSRSAPYDLTMNGGANVAEPKTQTSGLEGFIEGAVGSYGQKAIGGAVTVPLVEGKVLLRVEGYDRHTEGR